MKTILLRFVVAWLAAVAAHAQGSLISGPMLGYQAHREALVWLETKGAAEVKLTYRLAGQPQSVRTLVKTAPATAPAGTQPMKFVLPLLEMGQSYDYEIMIDGVKAVRPYPFTFKTTKQWEFRAPPPDFKFLFGSCAYLNDPPYDRPGKPYGHGTEIFKHMAASGADFMLWGGDNTYLREADFSSESGIWYRFSQDRATPDLQPLLATMHHYAAWDDHDFGSNDANKSFEFKDVTTAAFKAYWGNPTWGEPDNAGVYGKFFWGDAAFFVMDNRTHRDDDHLDAAQHPTKSQYGAKQRDWLKQSLLAAKTLRHFTFKFIVTGGQVLTDFGGASESFGRYQSEREDLLKFIVDHKITGVVFLTGDVHFTELAKKKIGATQWVYELTSSPLASGANSSAQKDRAADPQRVEGTLVADQNYCAVAISGPAKARVLTITCFDKSNVKRWEKTIAADELK
jgi:alkaline phosphatase D